ncbi:hypothetical protein J6P92_01135 [bacterium]|nr:hypothetical protein [bacterium]
MFFNKEKADTKADSSDSLNERVLKIVGGMDNEQIAEVFKVGYKNVVEDIKEILMYDSSITDKEVINLYNNKGNIDPALIKNYDNNGGRLRIIRSPKQIEERRKLASNAAGQAATFASQATNNAQDAENAAIAAETARTNAASATDTSNPSKADYETEVKNQAALARSKADAARKAAEEAKKKAEEVDDIYEATQETKDKADKALKDAEETVIKATIAETLANATCAGMFAQNAADLLSRAQNAIKDAEDLNSQVATATDTSIPTKSELIEQVKSKTKEARKLASEAKKAADEVEKAFEDQGEISDELAAAIEALRAIQNSTDEAVTAEEKAAAKTLADKAEEALSNINTAKSSVDNLNIDDNADAVLNKVREILGEYDEEEDFGVNGKMMTGIPPSPDEAGVYKLTRKNSSKSKLSNINVTPDGITVCLTNPLNDEPYYYRVVSLKDDESVKASFQVLDNGRIVITGNYIKLVAYEGQKDDLIIIGNNNEINTGDEKDIVRLGGSHDMSGLVGNKNESSVGSVSMLESLLNAGKSTTYDNTVYTGTGDDYIYDHTGGYNGSSYIGNTINGGDNNDSYTNKTLYPYVNPDDKANLNSQGINDTDFNSVAGVEQVFSDYSVQKSLDNIQTFESFSQGSLGDCRLISLFASFREKGVTLSDLGISITGPSGGKYTVTFEKYENAPKMSKELSQYSITVSEEELYKNITYNKSSDIAAKYNVLSSGDLTVRLVEYAMNELIKKNNKNKNKNLENIGYADYSRYLFGSETVSYTSNVAGNLDAVWALYQSGAINNLTAGTYDSSSKGYSQNLQLCSKHAYAIVDVTSEYVEVINPWDSQDRVRMDRDDFLKNFNQLIVYGYNVPSFTNVDSYHSGIDEVIYTENYDEIQVSDNAKQISVNLDEEKPTVYDEINEIAESIRSVARIVRKNNTLELFS